MEALYYGYLITGFPTILQGPAYGHTNIHEWRFKINLSSTNRKEEGQLSRPTVTSYR